MTGTDGAARWTAVVGEPHGALLNLLREILGESGVSIVAEPTTAEETFAAVQELQPEVLVLDLLVPRSVSVLRRVRRLCPAVRVVALLEESTEAYRRVLDEAGVHAYLEKRNLADLNPLLETLAAGAGPSAETPAP